MKHRFARPRIARALVAAIAFAATMAACADGDPSTGPGTSGRGGFTPSLLFGQWSHTIVFDGDNGDIHSSRTVWRFESDSTAQRLVIATSVAAGITDTVTANARWDATPSQLTIIFQPPDSGTVTFPYQVHLSTLTLDGVQFVRDE